MADGDVPPVALAEQPQSNKRLWKFGAWITAAWLGAFAIYVATCWPAFLKLHPNELGDFLAGVFAPLAFLWLVLGFFQQGEELQNSAAALWLQGRELQNSVEQQRELVNVTREQLKFDSAMLQDQRDEVARNSQPLLDLMHGGSVGMGPERRLITFYLLNHGKPCTRVKAVFERQGKKAGAECDVLATGGRLECRMEVGPDTPTEMDATVTYLDERLVEGQVRWRVNLQGFTVMRIDTQAS